MATLTNTTVSNIGLTNQNTTEHVTDALWFSTTLPWQLALPWQYTNETDFYTPLTNITI